MAAEKHNIAHYLFTIGYYLLKDIPQILFLSALAVAGLFILQLKKPPWDIMLGLPMILAFGGILVNKLISILYALLSPTYNRGVCVICNPSTR